MSRTLRIAIVAGEHTCRDGAEGPSCSYLRYASHGSGHCSLFDVRLLRVRKDGSPGKASDPIGRCAVCKKLEAK